MVRLVFLCTASRINDSTETHRSAKSVLQYSTRNAGNNEQESVKYIRAHMNYVADVSSG
jgi:hypothetical protein